MCLDVRLNDIEITHPQHLTGKRVVIFTQQNLHNIFTWGETHVATHMSSISCECVV
jgi:hypothetical protein